MQNTNECSPELQRALKHANSFAQELRKREITIYQCTWLAGRSVKVIGYMKRVLHMRNSGAFGDTEACDKIVRYLRDMHRATERALGDEGVGCCDPKAFEYSYTGTVGIESDYTYLDYEITGVSPDELEETASRVAKNEPKVMAHVREGMEIAEEQAHIFKNKIGDACPFVDVLAYAHEGLWIAARKFDESRATPYKPYAIRHIQYAMVDGVRNWGNLPRKAMYKLMQYLEELELQGGDIPPELAASIEEVRALGGSMTDPSILDDCIADERTNPEEAAARSEEYEKLREIIDELTTRRRTVIQRKYFDEDELQEIAKDFGHKKDWASKRHAKALESIRAELLAKKIRVPAGA